MMRTKIFKIKIIPCNLKQNNYVQNKNANNNN